MTCLSEEPFFSMSVLNSKRAGPVIGPALFLFGNSEL
jgi:hypothetical protein